ncbi:MAG: hypothetical protein ACP5IL_10695, partial [Syntrophobacteraceae bacterium]
MAKLGYRPRQTNNLGKEVQMRARFRFNVLILLILISMAACGASPQVKKTRYLAAGDKFFAQKQFKNALIEYG